MRLRRKSNTDERLNSCGKYLIQTPSNTDTRIDVLSKEYIDLTELFGTDKPLVVDLGCGMGKFACEYALAHKDVNVLAVERVSTVMLTGAERAGQENIENLRFLRTKAELLPKYLRNGSINTLFLNFSTPLPKKGNIKQRLTSPRFLQIYEDLLVDGGELRQKTDNKDFFEYSLEQISSANFTILYKTENLHATDLENIITEYERRFLSMGMPIYGLIARKGK